MVPAPGVALVDGGGTPSATASSRNSPAISSAQHAANARPKTSHPTPNGQPPPPSNPLSALKSASLDLASVERRGQPTACKEPVTKKNRPHGLDEAPTYYPNEEEWKDPFDYIRKISDQARQFGICKIVPPETWNPDFAIDTEKFHFKTRKQELNSIEGSSRANLSYVDGLLKFHKQQGFSTQNRLPYVDKKPLDLFRLKKAVEARGGFDKVCKLKKWAEIGRDLGYSGKIMSSLSTSLKNSYAKWIAGYEDYLAKAKPGVHQQLELEYGGPLTPSPAPSPMKRSTVNTPSSLRAESPVRNASDALQASVNGHADRDTPMADASPPRVPKTTGFTAVNSGGFTAVNSSFTSVNRSSLGAEQRGISTPKSFTPLSSAKNTPEFRPSGLGVSSSLKRQLSCDSLDSSNKENNGTDQEEGENGSRRSKRLKKDNVPTVAGSHMSLLRPSVPRIPRDETAKAGEKCESCGKGAESPGFLLICESCDHGYHGACLEPPVRNQPEEWNCPRCLVGDGQFGFEEGGLYSLKQFQQKAADFKAGYFEKKMPYDPVLNCHRPVTEDDVEREFWRLVADLEETVEVEYGADIHCTTHGSGFPTAERNPNDPYSADPWNLNIMPLHPKSLFQYIKSDISGMTVPWLYVGMIFSTFCWHAEDHFSYSVNYQHFGATKTWYGIPGEDADKFEAAMREAVPELFETQPDLLFQLVTLLTPEQLKKAGVRVYALDQRAGQFVITFPQAYHAGFNHGFNCNEAVNFAPYDWEPWGLSGVQKLQDFRRQPCFSHDELLWTAAEGTLSTALTIQTAKWLAPALEKVRQREIAQRDAFVAKHIEEEHGCRWNDGDTEECPLGLVVEDLFVKEEESFCVYCKAFTYLSRFKCTKSDTVLCLLHAGNYKCCDTVENDRFFGKDGHVLHYRKTAEDMETTISRVSDKANLPEAWEAKYEKLLDEETTPSLKVLRALLVEGEKIPYELSSLATLREFVERCNHWVDEATTYVVRKQQNRRKNEKAWQSSNRKSIGNSHHDQKERDLRNVDNVYRLLDQAEKIGFDCPEITQLQERAEAIKSFQANANKALENRQSETAERIEELLEEGHTFNVDIPEVEKLVRLLDRLKWEDKARANRGIYMNLGDVTSLIEEGDRLGIPAYNDLLQHYKAQLATGQQWEKKAQELINADVVHYPQLQALSDQAAANFLPVSADTLAVVDQILHKQREAHRQIIDLNKRIQEADYKKRPQYAEVAEVMKKIEELQAKPAGTLDLEREQRRHEDWMRKGKKLFGKTNAPLHILKSHMEYVLDRNLDCFNTTDDKPRQVPAEPASREPSPSADQEPGKHKFVEARPKEVFCICRRTEAGMMIECELCHEWYHGKCLKIARGKVKEDDKYTCPICDWRVKIPRDAARPKLEDLIAWYDEIPGLPFQAEEEDVLKRIVDNAQEFRNTISPYCNPMMSTRSEAVTQRFYLRKIEGAEILLAFETNFFRQELHKWYPVAPEPPPVLEESKSTRKPRPTKLMKLLNEYGVKDSNELPEHVRGKANSLKRKAMNAEAAAAQAATQSSSKPPNVNSSLTIPTLGSGSYVSSTMRFTPQSALADTSPSPTGFSHLPSGGPLSSSSSSQGQHARSNSLRDEPPSGFANDVYSHYMPEGLLGNGQVTLTDNSTLSLEERLLGNHPEKEDGDLAVDKAKALEIFGRTEEGRRKAEDLYGRDVWDKQRGDRTNTSAGGSGKAPPDANDPLGIGVEAEGDAVLGDAGDVDRMFGELVNDQDQDQEDEVMNESSANSAEGSKREAASTDSEHASSTIDAFLEGN